MENKEKERKFILHKAKAALPDAFDLQLRQERMVETQKQAYIKVHEYRDRMLTEDGRIKTFSHISGKMWFLTPKNKLDFIKLRIDIETTINLDSIYTGTMVVQKYSMFHDNKVLSINNYEDDSSEMESVNYRTYFFNATTFVFLMGVISSYYRQIWLNTVGLSDDYTIKYPNYTLDGYDKDLTPANFEIKEEESEEVLKLKNNLLKALKGAYSSNFLTLVEGSKLYTQKPSVVMSGNKPHTEIKKEEVENKPK